MIDIAQVYRDLQQYITEAPNDLQKFERVNEARQILSSVCPAGSQPVDFVRWVPVNMISPNDYNPNSVAMVEMSLLYRSIKHDGYTQPIVTIWDPEKGVYVIVDGFHRYFTGKSNQDLLQRNRGCLPIVVIDKDPNDRMAATVRHNRARGKHSITGMSSMVFKMLENGWEDAAICNELGMEPEELLKLKHITGFAKLFENVDYKQAWETKRQILIRKGVKNTDLDKKAPVSPEIRGEVIPEAEEEKKDDNPIEDTVV